MDGLGSYSDFQLFSSLTKSLGNVPSVAITIGITVTFMFHNFFFFLVLWQDLVSLFVYFDLKLYGLPGRQSQLVSRLSFSFSFFFFFLITTMSDLLAGIRRSICISTSQKILCVFLCDGFWFVHIPFGNMIKFQFLAQFPMDPLPHPVMFTFVLLLQ